jgi:hypothetical protein
MDCPRFCEALDRRERRDEGRLNRESDDLELLLLLILGRSCPPKDIKAQQESEEL